MSEALSSPHRLQVGEDATQTVKQGNSAHASRNSRKRISGIFPDSDWGDLTACR